MHGKYRNGWQVATLRVTVVAAGRSGAWSTASRASVRSNRSRIRASLGFGVGVPKVTAAERLADRALTLSKRDADQDVAITELVDLASGDYRAILKAEEICLSSQVEAGLRCRAIELLMHVASRSRKHNDQSLSVSRVVEKAFGGPDGIERARSYLASLLASMKDVSEVQRRSVFLLLLVAATFQLMDCDSQCTGRTLSD